MHQNYATRGPSKGKPGAFSLQLAVFGSSHRTPGRDFSRVCPCLGLGGLEIEIVGVSVAAKCFMVDQGTKKTEPNRQAPCLNHNTSLASSAREMSTPNVGLFEACRPTCKIVVSQNKGTRIWTPIYHNPDYGDPQNEYP